MKPTAVILDLLRTYAHRGTTVKNLMATGAMFDFNENLMRVSLSRLVARGIVENFKRGHYRLSRVADPLSDFVESWRLGEARVRDWDGEPWLLAHVDAAPHTKRDWALDLLGFREVHTALWARPDNLARSAARLERLLDDLGMDGPIVLASGATLHSRWHSAWLAHFDIAALRDRYDTCKQQLLQSMERLEQLPHDSALKESFHLGGAAVHILAKDPLLPSQFMDPTPRADLCRTMLAYDRKGREIWGQRGKDRPEIMPTPQLQVINQPGIRR